MVRLVDWVFTTSCAPVIPTRADDARQLETTTHADTASQRVLVVDDDGLVPRTIRAMLEDEGYTVDTAANVRQALERAIRHCLATRAPSGLHRPFALPGNAPPALRT
jgi:hypothetical protein